MNSDPHLLWIGGQSVPASSGEWFDDLNPIDDSLYATLSKANAQDVDSAVCAAQTAFESYRNSLPSDREGWLIRAAELLIAQSDEFVALLIDEVGSPISKARKEISTSVGLLRAAAGATRQLSGKTLPTNVPGRISISTRQPLGVIAGITPFNVPLIKGIKHSAMPLATGNTVVLLPSELAPLTTLRIAKLFSDAGIPDGAFNVITGNGYEIGDTLVSHPDVKLVGFTGSTTVGNRIHALCGQHGKRVTLEMGGKNPLVVLKDADLDKALSASVLGSFLYQGQICMASSRIYVERPVYDTFVDRLCAAASGLGRGDLRDPKTMIGPIISSRQRNRIQQHVNDAVTKGAALRVGGDWEGHRYQPTVLTDVSEDATLFGEETFGPVTAVYPIDSVHEALRLANASPYGLCASIFTSDLQSAMQFAQQVQAGMVHINGATIQEEPHVPFGGVGNSGFGLESTDVDLADLTQWKWITVQYDE
ncbi:aldehyde dehydrogenase family protein [Stieleria sp. TO1_6]|uniref:aldehyde dehydrogenase family protein n=1 Tax=Stieleria tagensis TaxID=2956795 RepID=UPI00209BB5D3|nr:aldehyde dehydrogenase family protein [Stieleria tagensis]MCO8121129.1 aldehyde dehydrogenase family protein [Stieleria tagensis]